MINRENLVFIQNILSLHNQLVDLDYVYSILTAIKENDNVKIIDDILSNLNKDITNVNEIKKILTSLFYAIKENDELSFYCDLLTVTNKNLNIDYLRNVLLAVKHNKDLEEDLYDSFSTNQFKSKTALLNAVDNLNILDSTSNVVIWGCWYGSILIPSLAKKVNKVTGIDLDERPTQIAKNKLFQNHKNVTLIVDDVFSTYRNFYIDTNLIINTSCEHMKPMKEWPWFQSGAIEGDVEDWKVYKTPKLSNNCWFAFQSNNMFGIEGHVNCVNSLQEFEDQLPGRAEVHYREEVEDDRGTRYMLVGKFNPTR